VSALLTWRALDEAGEARTAANRPAFPLKLPRWSCNLRQRAYNCTNLFSKWRFRLRCGVPGREARWKS
jgi:hypothetical protein